MRGTRRVEWVDAARGMAIAFVVLFHASKRSVSAGSADWWLDVTDLLQALRMPLLFAVAGLFAATWVSRERSWAAMLRTKVLLFCWVYAVWVLVRFAWFEVFAPPGSRHPSFSDTLLRVVQPEGAGWFMVALAVMFVLAKAVHTVSPLLVLGTAAWISIVFLAQWVRYDNAVWDGVGTYAFFFLLGVTLRGHVLEVSRRTPAWATVAVPVAWVLVYAVLATAGLETAPVVGFLLRVAGVAAGVAIALRVQHWAWLRTLGRGTLPVYLAHQVLVITAVGWLAALVAFDAHPALEHGAPLLLAVALLAVTYAFGRVAPHVGLGWLFATPRWLERLAGAPGLPQRQIGEHPPRTADARS